MHRSMWCSLALEWFKAVPVPGRPSYYKLLRQKLSEKEVDTYLERFRSQVAGRTVQYRGAVAYLWGKKDI